MKKLIFAVLLLFAVSAFGQTTIIGVHKIIPEYTTITLDSTTSSTLYITFPHPAGPTTSLRQAISTTAPTSTSAQARNRMYSATGDVFVAIIPDTVTAQESDSLYAYMRPLHYEPAKSAWYHPKNDSTFLVFDTPNTYTSTSIDYLDWTHGYMYSVSLSNQLWPAAGFSIKFGQVATDNAGADTKLYVAVYFVY